MLQSTPILLIVPLECLIACIRWSIPPLIVGKIYRAKARSRCLLLLRNLTFVLEYLDET